MEKRVYVDYLMNAAAAAAAAVVLLPAYIELFPMNFLLKEYPIWREQLEFVATSRDEEPEVLIMGDSRVQAALIPALVSAGSRSLAAGGSTPIEAYYLLRRYLEVHRPPRVVVLSFASFHLERHATFWERAVKWKALAAWECFEVFERSLALSDPVLEYTSRTELYGEWALYRLNYPPYYLAELENARLFLRRHANERKLQEVRAAAGHSFYGRGDSSSDLNSEAKRETFSPSPLLDAYLRDFLALAAERGIAVILAAMPINQTSYEHLSPSYRESYRAYLEELQHAYPTARVRTQLESLPDDHFGDPSHVNRRGAQRVSRRYAELLR